MSVPEPFALHSDAVFLPDGSGALRQQRAAVVIRGAHIERVLVAPPPEALPAHTRDVEGALAPGFIDLQNNGAYGVDVSTDEGALDVLARRLPEQGVTTVLPTLVCSTFERYTQRFLELRRRPPGAPGADIPGLHLEGPFFSPKRACAHAPSLIRPLELSVLEQLLAWGQGVLRMLTFAPELPNALRAIERCLSAGVVPSAGHSDATREEMERALAHGLPMVTHLTNAMRKDVETGPVGAVLEHGHVRAGVIVDGLHVRAPLLRTLYERLGPQRMLLVTDAAPPTGMPDGHYTLGGVDVLKRAGAVRLQDGSGTLAGSVLTLDEALRRARALLGISVEALIRMASQTPALAARLEDRGAISPGLRADLVVFDPETFDIHETLVAGVTCHRRTPGSATSSNPLPQA